ncbi:MAG: flagellar export chaperone FlgN [Phycisphaerales bacterium]
MPPAPPPPPPPPPQATSNARTKAANPSLEAAATALDEVLLALIAEHENLLKIATRHRAAIASADPRTMAECLNAQAAAAERIAGLERRRQAAVAAMGAPGPASRDRVTIAQLAAGLPEAVRARLLAAAERLREVLTRLHREHAAIRSAAESLSSHMEGLMRQICRRLSHAGTYARSGSIDGHVAVTTALDVRT